MKNYKENGLNVVDWEDGSKEYYLKGKLHREDGPALDSPSLKAWYLKGKLHREDGPALKTRSLKSWHLNGKRHREDGPAVEHSNGCQEWYLYGKSFTPTPEELALYNWNQMSSKYQKELATLPPTPQSSKKS